MIESDAPMKTAALAAFVLFLLVSCNGPKGPDIGIDGWWDVDYAANVCRSLAANGQMNCIQDPSQIARGIETEFISAFQMSTQCSGLSIVNDFHKPANDGASSKIADAKWSLSFNVMVSNGEVSEKDSTWDIIDSATLKRYASGSLENMNQAADRVCTMVKGRGGKLF